MKVDLFQPYEIKDNDSDIAKNHFHRRTQSSPTKYSFHFDTKLNGGSFYIEWEQIPQFIMDKTELYRSNLGYKKLYAPSAKELRRKINELFEAYMREYSNIIYVKKIGIELRNYLNNGAGNNEELSIGIRYIVFYTKTYYSENGNIFKEINVKSEDTYSSETKTSGYDIYDYSEELEDSIKGLQRTMFNGMKEFISKLGSKEDILEHFQKHNLLENKRQRKQK